MTNGRLCNNALSRHPEIAEGNAQDLNKQVTALDSEIKSSVKGIVKQAAVSDAMPSTNCQLVIAGVGGQGTVLASRILAEAGLLLGLRFRSAETIGMAQRGGSVVGHLRFMDCLSPLVSEQAADLLIGFEIAETVRALHWLKPGAAVICSNQVLVPATATLSGSNYDGSAQLDALKEAQEQGEIGTLKIIDTTKICDSLGSNKVQNIVLLGAAAAANLLPFSANELQTVIRKQIKPQLVELNLRAFAAGQEASS